MKLNWYQLGTAGIAAALAVVLATSTASAEVRCDGVTPEAVEKACGVKTHVVAGAGDDVGEKDCNRLLSADATTVPKPGAVSVHVLKAMAPLAQDPKWTDVKPIPGFDAAFSFKEEAATGEVVNVVAASRGGHTAYVTMVGAPLCNAEQATQLVNVALPAASADGRGTAFEASSGGPEMRDGAKLLVTAYAIIWLLVTGYLAYLWNTQKGLASRIEGLERAIDRAERSAAEKPKAKGKSTDEPKASEKPKAKAKPKPKDDEDDEEG